MSPTPTRTPARPWSALLVAVLALPLLGVGPSTPATAAPAPLPEAAAPTLRVATYNIRCANCSLNSRINSREKNWETRRAKVVAQIKAEKVDVIGLQEASQGLLRGTKISQFDDLVHRLGAPYALTNDKRYGCVKSTSYKNCVKDDNGASGGVRIVYNTNRLTLLGQGSKQLDNEAATSGPRFVAWHASGTARASASSSTPPPTPSLARPRPSGRCASSRPPRSRRRSGRTTPAGCRWCSPGTSRPPS